jgi:pimeloyl-ACP methyl ester carboxylesterase
MQGSDSKQDKLDALYNLGATTIFASKSDPRFSYTLYVPHRWNRFDRSKTTILVAVHGTGRMQSLYRDLFAEFAEYNNCIVLAPLFPAGVCGDDNLSGYKYMLEGDIRYDHVLLDMVDQVAAKYDIPAERLLMFGFSGGAHFTHRFTILHPHRIRAASIGAPGSVTLLDTTKRWWVGIKDCAEHFGIDADPGRVAGLPMHFVVGDADTETWEITFEPGDRYYVEGANDAGRTRGDRIRALADSFAAHGARVRLDVVDGATHDVTAVAHKTRAFFADVLNGES